MASHFRSSHSASHIATGTHAALPLILEHILTHPERYHISTGRQQNNDDHPPPTSIASTSAAAATCRQVVDRSALLRQAGNTFKEILMEKVAMSPSQPFRLPPTYIMDFVRSVFTEDLCLVDFTQALTAMDYLKDLETRRKRETALALERLGLDLSTLEQDKDRMRLEKPVVAEWVVSVTDKAKRIESLYSQVYIGLRRWTLINEMRLEPFNKANCIAMLNTLYPPTYTRSPTSQLTTKLLNTQRNAFFRYILAVESNGKDVLQKLEQQGKRSADVNAWPIVRDIVDKYLRTANSLVQECTAVICEEDITMGAISEKRTDSGVSFASSKSGVDSNIHPAHRRPSVVQAHHLEVPTRPLVTADPASPSMHHRTPSSGEIAATPRPEPLRQRELRKASTLERLTRELKRIRSRSNEGRDDIVTPDRPRSRSRGPSDASHSSGLSGDSSNIDDGIDPFASTIARLPVPPTTATTLNFPDYVKDEISEHRDVLPLSGQVVGRSKGLKKMKSAGNLGLSSSYSREHMTGLKHAPGMERKASAQGLNSPTIQLYNSSGTTERKYSIPQRNDFVISEEQRRDLIARARAEREPLGPHPSERRHSPIESRVDALLNGNYSSTGQFGAMAIDLLTDAPVRRNSPGRNKLRDYFGVTNFEIAAAGYAN